MKRNILEDSLTYASLIVSFMHVFVFLWEFLGLKGTKAEIDRSFGKVDVDASGVVDRYEFAAAVKDSRLAELSLTVLMTQMDGKLEGMEKFFGDYKKRLEESKQAAALDLANNQEAFARFQKTAVSST